MSPPCRPARASGAAALCAAAVLSLSCSGLVGDKGVPAGVGPGVPSSGGGSGKGPRTGPTMPGMIDQNTIPMAHPRLFFTPARLDRAKQWFATHPFTPRDDNPIDVALHYVLAHDTASARTAIDYAMGIMLSTTGVASDPARWEGERVITVFDWCYDQMTQAERDTLISRWNGYLAALDAKSWGGVGMEGNNYYTGYMRNAIEWGIASFWENSEAPAILDYGLTARWTNSFLPFTAGAARGGVPHEGTQYGRGVLDYYTIPLTSVTLLGRDIWNETDYFKDSIFYLIYSMTPAKTTLKGSTSQYFETYPYNDDETWNQGNSAATGDVGTYLTPLLEIWHDSPLAGFIQQYLNVTGAGAERYAQSVQMPATPTPFDGLAFDFFAPGIQYFYTRTGWGSDAMAINMQLGVPKGVGHNHLDAGTFQISRKGRWLTRETVTYTDQIVGWNNGAAADGRAAFGHNAVLFQGKGQVDTFDGPPQMLRLESRDAYSYAAVDLTPSYMGGDNAAVQKIIREFVFIRPLETLVILDRMAASSASAVKSFVLHSETTAPSGSGSTTIQNGDQALQVITLLPAGAPYRVIQEGGAVGQYRLEVDSSGAAESYFLHVLHGKDMSAPALQASLTDTGSGWQVSITNPSGGSAIVTFEKGLTSQGGTFGYAATGTPSPSALIDHVQTMDMTDTGPAWR